MGAARGVEVSRVSHVSEVMPEVADYIRQARCAHVWPAELTPDATCQQGCGQAYGDWAEKKAGQR